MLPREIIYESENNKVEAFMSYRLVCSFTIKGQCVCNSPSSSSRYLPIQAEFDLALGSPVRSIINTKGKGDIHGFSKQKWKGGQSGTYLRQTPASTSIILPPPPAPDPATDPSVRPAPFTLLPAHLPAHVPNSLTP